MAKKKKKKKKRKKKFLDHKVIVLKLLQLNGLFTQVCRCVSIKKYRSKKFLHKTSD